MRKLFILLVVCCCYVNGLQGQVQSSEKFVVSVHTGLSIPSGSFGRSDIATSVYYSTLDPQGRWVSGIDKSKSGFAQTGYFVHAETLYKIRSVFGLFIRGGYTTNPVQTQGISDFLSSRSAEQRFVHEDYEMWFVAPGINLEKRWRAFAIHTSLSAGMAFADFPSYESILLYTTTDPPSVWRNIQPTPTLVSSIVGISVGFRYNVSKAFSLGLETLFQRSEFDYDVQMIIVPGGNPDDKISDRLKVRTTNIGITFGYNFGKGIRGN